mmetsp:Transcript_74600/g.242291  ORF Transcript_74600/g.242291 Transcript_74600/m.242291 type:complete len:214 (-) Transcript_74600:49-690(-)
MRSGCRRRCRCFRLRSAGSEAAAVGQRLRPGGSAPAGQSGVAGELPRGHVFGVRLPRASSLSHWPHLGRRRAAVGAARRLAHSGPAAERYSGPRRGDDAVAAAAGPAAHGPGRPPNIASRHAGLPSGQAARRRHGIQPAGAGRRDPRPAAEHLLHDVPLLRGRPELSFRGCSAAAGSAGGAVAAPASGPGLHRGLAGLPLMRGRCVMQCRAPV